MKGRTEEFKDVEYESLPAEASETRAASQRTIRSRCAPFRWNLASFGIGCLGTLVTMAIFLAIARTIYHPRTVEDPKGASWNDCGHTSRLAMERGCVMDPAFYAWMPPQCYYHELTSSLPSIFEDREYFADEDLTQKLQPEQLYLGEFERVYTLRYHDDHCLFQWRKLQYAIDNKLEYVDNLAMNYPHAKHCADSLSEAKEPGTGKGQEVELAFYHCMRVSW